MKIFIAGIMQGSKTEVSLHQQDYRTELKIALKEAFPAAEVYDPLERNSDSLFYTPEHGKSVFLTHNKMCGTEIDLLVAYLPEASMGTAIEIWEAWKNGATVVAISPLNLNWVVKFLSDSVYPDMKAFMDALQSGEIAKLVETTKPRSAKRSCDDFIMNPNQTSR